MISLQNRALLSQKVPVPLPSWNKLGEFLVNIMQLERSVEVLKEQNKQLNTQVLALQRQVDEQ